MPDCRRFEGITPEKLESLRQELARLGITVPADGNGTVEAMGVKLSVAYTASELALEVCILEKPSFVPDTLVWAQVEKPLRA
jgi:hypothetical protein